MKLRRQVVGKDTRLFEIDLHSLEALFEGGLDIVDFHSFRHVAKKFGSIELVVRTVSLENLGLFLQGEVLVFERRVNVFFVKIQHFVVGNDPGVGEVVDSSESLLRHGEGGREHFGQNSHGIGDVDNLFVLADLGDEATVNEVVRDGHTHAKDHTGGVGSQHRLQETLRFGVPGAVKVGLVLFGETNPRAERVGIVVLEDASSGVDGAVNSLHVAEIGDVEGTNDVGTNRFRLVVFAPVNVGSSCNSSRHENVRRLDLVELCLHRFSVFDSSFRIVHLDA